MPQGIDRSKRPKASSGRLGPAAIARLEKDAAEAKAAIQIPSSSTQSREGTGTNHYSYLEPFEVYRPVHLNRRVRGVIAQLDEQIGELSDQYDPLSTHKLVVPLLPASFLVKLLLPEPVEVREAGRMVLAYGVGELPVRDAARMLKITVSPALRSTEISLWIKHSKVRQDRHLLCKALGSVGLEGRPPTRISICLGTLPEMALGERDELEARLRPLAPVIATNSDWITLGEATLASA